MDTDWSVISRGEIGGKSSVKKGKGGWKIESMIKRLEEVKEQYGNLKIVFDEHLDKGWSGEDFVVEIGTVTKGGRTTPTIFIVIK